MAIPKFDPREMEVKASIKDFFGQETRIYSYPVSMHEAVKGMLRKEPYWQLNGMYMSLFSPKVNPDNIARGQIFEAQTMDPKDFGGKDMFGIEWEYVPQVGGSMVRPGNPFCEDANEIEEKLVWPDVDSWDWEGSAKANENYLDPNACNVLWFLNGWYERLISFMDFEGAIMALVDEDQQDAVKELFDKLSDLYIHIFRNALDVMPEIDGFCIHDDWGGQKETFFSPAIVEEMIVPYMKRVTDYLHSRGKTCELHSCGNISRFVPYMIDMGVDFIQLQRRANDVPALKEKYGDKIGFNLGLEGVDVGAPIPPGQEMVELVHRTIDLYAAGGGFYTMTMTNEPQILWDVCQEVYWYSREYYEG